MSEYVRTLKTERVNGEMYFRAKDLAEYLYDQADYCRTHEQYGPSAAIALHRIATTIRSAEINGA